MRIVFNIEYYTEFGENLCVLGSIPELGSWDESRASRMDYVRDGKWRLELFVDEEILDQIEYKYILKDERSLENTEEWGKPRTLSQKSTGFSSTHLIDKWRPSAHPENPLFTSAFAGNLWRRKPTNPKKKNYYNHVFQLYAPRIDENHHFCVTGDATGLGKWIPEEAIMMDDSDYPLWKARVFLEEDDKPINYKFGIYDKKQKKLVSWEGGDNRVLEHDVTILDNSLVINTEQHYRYRRDNWNGAGVAIPVFSIRTKKSFGVGEFPDLKTMVDWAVQTNLKLIQILPINDTVATHSWADSYPYAAISVFALHPVYLHLPAMGTLRNKTEMGKFIKEGKKLNKNSEFDYKAVMELKSRFYKKIYDQDKKKFLNDKGFQKFFNENRDWMVPYAAFSYLRDKYKTADFKKWKEFSDYDPQKIKKLVDSASKIYDDIAIHYFIQYHLHLQLSEVVEYARKKGVILKGDLPIGIYRNSVDAWVEPRLYNMDKQAGAPPDAFSATGQNWKFPTYNWEEMAKDNYAWWRRRLTQMAKYFDAYRIDHILGFFRIWEIPADSVEGLLGFFNPAIPLQKSEIEERGVFFDFNRFCKPYVRDHILDDLFGVYKNEVITKYLDHTHQDHYQLKAAFSTQKKILEHLEKKKPQDEKEQSKDEQIKNGLFSLVSEVLFLEDENSETEAYHPRIAFHDTYSFRELDDNTKSVSDEIYLHYYYHRQEDYWREQALIKLPAITSASDMLVCGEDLGMVPDCVPDVLHELGILRLFIQRMPKETDREFGYLHDAPYLSVASPSTHDMSTLRGWWEEDREQTNRYFRSMLGHSGEAPPQCEPWIVEEILIQHLYSSAMWTIFPIQDLLATDEELRREEVHEERINVPGNPENQWKYRMHLNLEDLNREKGFNRKIEGMIRASGRCETF